MKYSEIDSLHDKYIEEQQKYLKANGWDYSCRNPMAIWLWEKEINGERFTLPQKTAYEMQCALDDIMGTVAIREYDPG